MAERNWTKELSKIDKQLESLSDEALFPAKAGPEKGPAQVAARAVEKAAVVVDHVELLPHPSPTKRRVLSSEMKDSPWLSRWKSGSGGRRSPREVLGWSSR